MHRVVLTMVGISVGLVVILGAGVVTQRLKLNLSSSMPQGVYLCTDVDVSQPLTVGVLVTFLPSKEVREELRRVAPAHVHDMLFKRVAAVPKDIVCFDNEQLLVNNEIRAPRPLLRTYALRDLEGCMQVEEGAVVVLGDGERSYDSRYFGSLAVVYLQQTCEPLLTWGEVR